MGAYKDFHRRSLEQREKFWSEQARLVVDFRNAVPDRNGKVVGL